MDLRALRDDIELKQRRIPELERRIRDLRDQVAAAHTTAKDAEAQLRTLRVELATVEDDNRTLEVELALLERLHGAAANHKAIRRPWPSPPGIRLATIIPAGLMLTTVVMFLWKVFFGRW